MQLHRVLFISIIALYWRWAAGRTLAKPAGNLEHAGASVPYYRRYLYVGIAGLSSYLITTPKVIF
jgi:hypothetical protein